MRIRSRLYGISSRMRVTPLLLVVAYRPTEYRSDRARESFAFHERVGDWLGCADARDVAGDTAGAAAIARKAGAIGEVARFERRAGTLAAAAVRLTQREDQVVNFIAAGLSTREAGLRLGITSRTVENHLANAYDKLGIRSRRELAERLS